MSTKPVSELEMFQFLLNLDWDPANRPAAIARLEQMEDLIINLGPRHPLRKQLEQLRNKIYKHFDNI